MATFRIGVSVGSGIKALFPCSLHGRSAIIGRTTIEAAAINDSHA
jgi:hypothetical protein